MNGNLRTEPLLLAEANASGIYWGAVIAGAFVTAAIWLTLTILGVGLGLSAVSPWTHASVSSKTLNVGAIIWLIVSQIIASSLGGYLAGRWRVKWPMVHTNEVYFRDTAHGFLVWAVAVVVSAAFLSTTLSAILGSDVKDTAMATAVGSGKLYPAKTDGPNPTTPGGTILATPGGTSPATPGGTSSTTYGGTTTTPPGGSSPTAPGDTSPTMPGGPDTKAPGGYITTTPGGSSTTTPGSMSSTTPGGVAPGKSTFSPPGGELRTTTPTLGVPATPTPQEMEQARKAAAKTSIWMFVALLIGAFCASLAATIGGKQRDSVVYYEVETRDDSGLIK